MLSFFRQMSSSRIGSFILGLFALLVLASFAMSDIQGMSLNPFALSSDTLAKVGSLKVSDQDMSKAMERRLGQARQDNGEATYTSIAGDFLPLLASLIDERAIEAFTQKNGFSLSKRLIDAEISQIPGVKGLDGKFSDQAYAALLQQQRMTDGELRQLIAASLLQRQLLTPASSNPRMPVGMATPYASMLLEGREGEVALIPTEVFAAGLKPADAQLQQYYAANKARYTVPEQRVLRLAKIGPEQVANAKPSDADVQAYYRDNAATYASKDIRSISQVVVQDQKTAAAIAARVNSGATIAAAAAPAGANAAVSTLPGQTRQAYGAIAGDKAAAAIFAAANGSVVGPVQSDFGWIVAKVDSVRTEGGKSFEQARPEIEAKLATSKQQDALADLVGKIEDQIAGGSNYAEAAKSAGLTVTETPLITANGTSRADSSFKLPANMAQVLKTGFDLAADDQPVIETLPDNAGFVLVAPSQIVPAAPAPLASIRDTVAKDWIAKEAGDRARQLAASIAKAADGKGVLAKAIADAKVPLPAPRPVAVRRIQLSQLGDKAPPPLTMLFTLGAGHARMVADPQGRGFYVVKVKTITPGNALNQVSLISEVQKEFSQALSQEYAEQFMAAIRKEVGVKRNETAIVASKARITSAGG